MTSLRRRLAGGLWLSILLLAAATPGSAQILGYDLERPRPVRSLTAGPAWVDFSHTGSDTVDTSFGYHAPALMLTFTQPNMEVTLIYGRDEGGDRELYDVAAATWGVLGLSDHLPTGQTRLGIPVAFYLQFRRAAHSEPASTVREAFEITAVGLGTGLVLTRPFGDRVVLEARATPTYALALRSLGDAAGGTALVEAAARLHVGPLVRDVGLTLGYDFRWQRWDLRTGERFGDVPDDFFDYAGLHHAVTLGLNW